jgi:hypothetical protein
MKNKLSMLIRKLSLRAVIITLAISGLNIAGASTIVSVSGPDSAGSDAAGLSEGWSTSVALQDVMISALLANGNGLASVGVAYLTTSIGPGTPAADEIAQSDVILCAGCMQDVVLFSGLNLAPGTYWLTFGAPAPPASFLNWVTGPPSEQVVSTSPETTYLGFEVLSPDSSSFAPDGTSFFGAPLTNGIAYDFSVTGTAVPEPEGPWLAAAAMIAILAIRRLQQRKRA